MQPETGVPAGAGAAATLRSAPPGPALAVRRISKTFTGTKALREVDLELAAGEIHALVGENGSGKSTLVKILTGYHAPDADTGAAVEIGGTAMALPLEAQLVRERGLSFVHQHSALVQELSVLENMALARGYARGRLGRIDWRAERARVAADLQVVALDLDPDTLVRELGPSEAKLVEIARALSLTRGGGRVLVLDEPTAALPQSEIDRLLDAIRRLAAEGVATLYISHRLDEVLSVADAITVFRNGERIWTKRRGQVDMESLVHAISGPAPTGRPARRSTAALAGGRLVVRGLGAGTIDDVGFELAAGEIVGVGGALGCGGSELGRVLAGAQVRRTGTVAIDGEEISFSSPRHAIRHGVVYVGNDRQRHSAFPSLTLRENVAVSNLGALTARGVVVRGRERSLVEDVIARFDVRPPQMERQFATLSGGNQQKAVIGRWLTKTPRLLVLDEPTQAVDVGARASIHGLLRGVAEAGAGIVVISSDFKELAELCDRVLVLREGRLAASCSGDELVPERMQLVAHGGVSEGRHG